MKYFKEVALVDSVALISTYVVHGSSCQNFCYVDEQISRVNHDVITGDE